MAVPSRPFFDLGPAVAISRSLLRAPRGGAVPTVPLRVTVEAPVQGPPPPPPPAASLHPFRRSQIRYAAELWNALLLWATEGIGAEGAFAVDARGFPIATVGASFAAPAEVLLAAFTSVEQLLAPYTDAEVATEQLAIKGAEPVIVHLYRLEWHHEALLLGFVGGRLLGDAELQEIRHTMVSELDSFTATVNPEV